MAPTTRWRRAQPVLWRTAPGFLALAAVDGRTIVVQGAGCDIWEALDGWIAEDELVAQLASLYETATEVVAADVGQLLRDLQEQGYVEAAD